MEKSQISLKIINLFLLHSRIRSRVRRSIPDLLQWDEFKSKKRFKDHNRDSDREFSRDVWNKWFDMTYPPTPSSSEWSEDEEEQEDVVKEEKPKRLLQVFSRSASDSNVQLTRQYHVRKKYIVIVIESTLILTEERL